MNGLDGIFILTILLLAFWGFKIGLIGAAIWFIAAYISVVLGALIVGLDDAEVGPPREFRFIGDCRRLRIGVDGCFHGRTVHIVVDPIRYQLHTASVGQ